MAVIDGGLGGFCAAHSPTTHFKVKRSIPGEAALTLLQQHPPPPALCVFPLPLQLKICGLLPDSHCKVPQLLLYLQPK